MIVRIVERHPFRSATIFVAFLVVATFLIRGIVFETVDDYNVMMTLAGEKTGSPYFQLTFFNCFLAFIISALYSLYDGVQWYSLVSLVFVSASLSCIYGLVLKRIVRSASSLFIAALLLLVCYFALFIYPIQRLQFTTTSAMLGAAACGCVAYAGGHCESRKTRLQLVGASCIFIVFCFLQRMSVSYFVLIFWGMALIRMLLSTWLRFLKLNIRDFRQLGICALSALICITGAYVFHHSVLEYGDNSSYVEYNKYRSAFQDYPRPSYQEAPKLYDSIGWGPEVWGLAVDLIFIDPGINQDNFRTIVESSEMASMHRSLRDALKSAYHLIRDNNAATGVFIICIGVYLTSLLALFLLRNRADSKYLFLQLAFFSFLYVVVIGLSLYLCLKGRWLLRLFQAIVLPAFVCNIIVLAELVDAAPLRILHGKHVRSQKGAVTVNKPNKTAVSMMLLVVFAISAYFTTGLLHQYEQRDRQSVADMRAVEEYALTHKQAIFMHDYTFCNTWNSHDPFRVYEGSLTNLIMSGGSYAFTGCYYKQLTAMNLTSFTGETLLQDNVFFVSDDRHPSFLRVLRRYLDSRYPHNELLETIQITDHIFAYNFTQVDTDSYSYEINIDSPV